ncbi:hypothetical protein M9Y10_029977 [Tritrichomonas musculus]|uniref:Protein kinase domain-containing protein n=1 Tax=Tritrichomonas musculus TaxID=1915356 RepID=A0ABR2KNU6_9EUKA
MSSADYDSKLIDINEYTKEKLIGKGKYGEVFESTEKRFKYTKLAAKKYYDDLDKYPNKFINNLKKNVNKLISLKHRCINEVSNYSLTDFEGEQHLVLISKYKEKGSLSKHIFSLTPTLQICNIYGIALGMAYLHGENIIHGNLHPNNIVENERIHPEICDFDSQIIRFKRDDHFQFGKTLIYTPPETFKGEEYTKSSDVYSYAIIVYEIIAGEHPFQDMSPFEIITKVVNGERPPIPSKVPECYRMLIEKCWAPDPNSRPTFAEIVQIIDDNYEFLDSIGAEYFKFGNYRRNEFYLEDNNCGREMKDAADYNDKSEEDEKEEKDKKDEEDKKEEKDKEEEEDTKKGEDKKDEDLSLKLNVKSISIDKFSKQSKIGEGNYADAYKIIDKKTGQIFVAKISKREIDEDSKEMEDTDAINLSKEVDILLRVDHPSIIKFIGYSGYDFDKEFKPMIITEYVKNGSLDHILQLNEESQYEIEWNPTKRLINIYGIASAMSYLHHMNILHLDLKAANILIDENFAPKVSDFGLSEDLSEKANKDFFIEKNKVRGTPTHIAPEIWQSSKYSKAGDVYSFGITVYEILTNEKPFKDSKCIYQLINEVVNLKKRPKYKYALPMCYRKLIEDCWAQNPEDRPTFDQILDQLKNNKSFVKFEIVDEDMFLEFVNKIDHIYNPPELSKAKKKATSTSNTRVKSKSRLYWSKSLLKLKSEIDNDDEE